MSKTLKQGLVGLVAVNLSLSAFSAPLMGSELVWQTRLQLSVVQWLPMQGEFRQVDALSGEFEVGSDGQLLLPILGPVAIGDGGPDQLAQTIAAQLQERLGMLQVPDVRVQVVGQRPIYVVGMVEAPGEHAFRAGLTVLQALALGGGPLRAEEQTQDERISLLAEQTTLRNDIRSSLARLARLEAEADGADEISFSDELDGEQSAALLSQEQRIYTLRVEGLQRQQSSLTELKELYNAEIEVLRSRITNLDQRIETAEADLARVNTLFGKGLATVSQRNDIEIMLGDLRSDRLDHLTAQMRAQQLISQADRDLTSLEDGRKSEVAESLLAERAALARLKVENVSVTRRLEELDRQLMIASASRPSSGAQIGYRVIRLGKEMPATEESLLEPGDVVKVLLETAGPGSSLPESNILAAGPTR
jgi:polysaccharide export outer membrane protein